MKIKTTVIQNWVFLHHRHQALGLMYIIAPLPLHSWFTLALVRYHYVYFSEDMHTIAHGSLSLRSWVIQKTFWAEQVQTMTKQERQCTLPNSLAPVLAWSSVRWEAVSPSFPMSPKKSTLWDFERICSDHQSDEDGGCEIPPQFSSFPTLDGGIQVLFLFCLFVSSSLFRVMVIIANSDEEKFIFYHCQMHWL